MNIVDVKTGGHGNGGTRRFLFRQFEGGDL